MKNWICPTCDAENSSDRIKCKCGQEQGMPAQPPENISSVSLGNDKDVIMKTYTGKYEQAQALFQKDSVKMAAQGYYPKSQNWVPGSYGCGSFLVALLLCIIVVGVLVFIYMLLVKPAGTLSVTYERKEQAKPMTSPTEEKTCPKCAEQVKAAAKICRFCGHEFTSIETEA